MERENKERAEEDPLAGPCCGNPRGCGWEEFYLARAEGKLLQNYSSYSARGLTQMEQGPFVQRRMRVPNCSTHCTMLIANPFRAKVVLTVKLLRGGEPTSL